jgi:NAD+ synthase (glutamine-hydrolysing)
MPFAQGKGKNMRLVIAQSNLLVGDIEGNCERLLASARQAVSEHQAELVVFPELALSGYPPEDLLLRPSLNTRVREALEKLQQETPVALLLGYPAIRQGVRANVVGFIKPGCVPVEYVKRCLPNYRVFDEKRYFHPGTDPCVIEFQGLRLALSICEDVWHEEPVAEAAAQGADLLLNINASPFRREKHEERLRVVGERARAHHLPIVYCNLVGGQDELVFDGGSMAVSATGEKAVQAPFFEECLWPVEVDRKDGILSIGGNSVPVPQGEVAVWQALVLALRDYVSKNGFRKVVLGLSGGIDSALVLALAVEALGADKVQALMMPYHYTAQMSLEDAEAEARALGVDYQVLPIASVVEGFGDLLAPLFAGAGKDTTEENLQARCRGVLLMAISNKQGALVLPTGNKSEMAVGYATLYGDMVGGFAVLKDVSKTWVYRLARYCNQKAGRDIIPQRVITRPPSAELAPGQVDQDSLPDYDLLDAILACYVEQDMSAEATIRAGFDRDTVYRVVKLVDRNEYKRRQAAPGPRITQRAFGKDRRYPITNGWRPGD